MSAEAQTSAPTQPEQEPVKTRPSPIRLIGSQLSVRRISAVYLWIFFLILFSILVPDTYLTGTTMKVVFGEGVVTCLIALAFLVPLAAGIYDLSVGANMALSLSLSIYLSTHSGMSPVIGGILALLACVLVGFISGLIVVRLRVDSFIATLGVSEILLGVVILISNNQQFVGEFPSWWSNLGNGTILGIPNVDFYLVGVALVVWYVLEFTRVGRYLFATGGNLEAARLAGLKTDRLRWGSLIASGFIAGLAGIVYSMKVGVFSASTGPGYLFPAISAVFLGASQFSQRPNVWGTLIAYFALAFGVQGLLLWKGEAAAYSEPLFQGTALVVAVALAARPVSRKLKERKAENERRTRPHLRERPVEPGAGDVSTGGGVDA
jgi:ribose transport system permease protein